LARYTPPGNGCPSSARPSHISRGSQIPPPPPEEPRPYRPAGRIAGNPARGRSAARGCHAGPECRAPPYRCWRRRTTGTWSRVRRLGRDWEVLIQQRRRRHPSVDHEERALAPDEAGIGAGVHDEGPAIGRIALERLRELKLVSCSPAMPKSFNPVAMRCTCKSYVKGPGGDDTATGSHVKVG